MYNVVFLGKLTVFSNYGNIISFVEEVKIFGHLGIFSQPHSDVGCFGHDEESDWTGCDVVRQV